MQCEQLVVVKFTATAVVNAKVVAKLVGGARLKLDQDKDQVMILCYSKTTPKHGKQIQEPSLCLRWRLKRGTWLRRCPAVKSLQCLDSRTSDGPMPDGSRRGFLIRMGNLSSPDVRSFEFPRWQVKGCTLHHPEIPKSKGPKPCEFNLKFCDLLSQMP